MNVMCEDVQRESEIYNEIILTLEGMGFDFDLLSKYVKHDFIIDYDGYVSFLQGQIAKIENERGLSYKKFLKKLTLADKEEYAPLLFIVLADTNDRHYHPIASYHYKSPSDEEKKLIRSMLNLYPYEDGWFKDELGSVKLKREESSLQKEFTIEIEGCNVKINNFEKQKDIFAILADEYVRLGLDKCFPYGEGLPCSTYFTFPICKHHLTQQLAGKRGGGNKKAFPRDLMYRLNFLFHIDEWYHTNLEEYAHYIVWYYEEYPNIDIRQFSLSRKDASLIADILGDFSIYDAGFHNDRASRVISLMAAGKPDIDVVYRITMNHPSVIKHLQTLQEEAETSELQQHLYDATLISINENCREIQKQTPLK